jgi:hypothetical protein
VTLEKPVSGAVGSLLLTPPLPPQRLPLQFGVHLLNTIATPSHKLPIVVIARGIILALIAALIVEVLFCRWLARRNWRPATTRITIAAGIAALVGPACAVLPYTDYLPARLSPDLEGVWLLSAIGAIGIGIGFCVQYGQQGRRHNLRPDQYPRRRLLGIHRRLCLHGGIEVSQRGSRNGKLHFKRRIV